MLEWNDYLRMIIGLFAVVGPVSTVPLFLTSSFVFDSAEQARALFADEEQGNIYSRYSNPNSDELVRKLCALEGAETGLATASGMAAVFASLAALLSSGDHVLAARALFGSTHQLLTRVLPRWGITSSYVDITATAEEWEAAVQPTTRMIFVETPSNPGLDLIDMEMLATVCRRRGLRCRHRNEETCPAPMLHLVGGWKVAPSLRRTAKNAE